MTQSSILELAKQGQSKAIVALLAKALENQATVHAGFKDKVFVIRAISETPLDQDDVVALLTKVLTRIENPKLQYCTIEGYLRSSQNLLWTESINLTVPMAEDLTDIPNLAIEDEKDSATALVNPVVVPTNNSWKFPEVNFGGLRKVSEQVADQAVKMAQDTAVNTHGVASKATEQALRSSIDQTMNAFQVAVEQIHDRKLPAKMAALTGTINVGVIQLSIRLDIPMDEETGEIVAEMK